MERHTGREALSSTRNYREIIFSIALFLFFDPGVLVMNFYCVTQIAEDAVSLNLAARLQMISQRSLKDAAENSI